MHRIGSRVALCEIKSIQENSMLRHPKTLQIQNFNYELPESRIAQYPLAIRDESKLLVFENEQIRDRVFYDLHEELPSDTLLVFNDTKVVQVRLQFERATGGKIEVFCLEPAVHEDIQLGMGRQGEATWNCLLGNARKWNEEALTASRCWQHAYVCVTATKIKAIGEQFQIHFSWIPAHFSFAEMLEHIGLIPLPPYMKRQAGEEDRMRYQTVYARQSGAVAAPTAGLHFTDRVFVSLNEKGVERQFLTLHVGAGTFKPVKADVMENHEMHSEEIYIEKSLIIRLIEQPKVVAVGTTSMRSLESLYWLGVHLSDQANINKTELYVGQWDPYELPQGISVKTALESILNYLNHHNTEFIHARTSLMIAPSYPFKMVDGLITNFHQPESTLLLLISAFIGDKWKQLYDHALKNDYRFLSYGDSSLLWRANG